MFGEKGLQGKYLVFDLLSVKISLNSYPIALFTKGHVFLLWNIIAAFSLAYLEVLGIFKVAANEMSTDFCIGFSLILS